LLNLLIVFDVCVWQVSGPFRKKSSVLRKEISTIANMVVKLFNLVLSQRSARSKKGVGYA